MNRKVIPFQIAIGPYTSGDAYPVRATFAGAETLTELQLPDPVLDATADLLELGELALDDADLFGRMLGRALLTPPLRAMLLDSVKAAAQAGGRLQLQLQIAPPELALLPWELVTLGLARPWSPALRDDYALTRVMRGGRPTPPVAVAGPLQLLAVAAHGEERQLDALENALAADVRAGRLALQLLRDATPAALERALMAGPIHVLHCAAPVVPAERGAPRLLLRRGMDPFDLAELLASARDLRLLTLSGTQGDAHSIDVALPRLAALLMADIPATIAFSGPLPATIAARFAAACYVQLAAGAPVDLAVTAGRRALSAQGNERSWGSMQLRITSGSEQLFAFRRSPRAPIALGKLLPMLGAAAVLVALFFGVRAGVTRIGAAAIASTATPALPTAGIMTPTPTTAPSLLKSLFGDPAPTETPIPTALPAPARYATFSTGPDDTLDSIAQRMGSDPGAIASLNQLDPNVLLRADYPLVIPVYRDGEAGAGGLIIRRGNPAEPKIALTFDIEIDDATLYSILDILRARGLHGTFFTTGRWVIAFPDAARAIVRDGHQICNHSLTHPYFSRIGLNGAASELEQTEQIILKATGVTSRPCFRFPYGDSTPDASAVVARSGYVAYHWSADDDAITGWLNWAEQHKSEANGGILLMHGRPSTVAALSGWLDRLDALGLHPTTLNDTLR